MNYPLPTRITSLQAKIGRPQTANEKRPRRRAFTLLELLLTLSMAVVLMTLVNAAFQFYARDMDKVDVSMRQTMLASALMQMIEDDLRATVHPEALDTSALEELLQNTSAVVSGGQGGEGGQGQGGAGEVEQGDAEAAGIAEEEPIEEEFAGQGIVLESPGLIGNQYQIQIDASRLPRLEEYSLVFDENPATLNDVPSDLKTVSYYVQDESAYGIDDPLAELDTTVEPTMGGLVRRVLDRSVTTFAAVSGNMSSLSQTGELLAPEVLQIEFEYWDGVTWQIEWNSDEIGELPLAVQIQITMTDPRGSEVEDPTPQVFKHVVRLPMAKVIEEEEDDMASDEDLS